MALAEDLLQQAEHLASLGSGRPSQANLRRAISTAYYALFHLLVAESIRRISPKSPPNLAARIGRAFVHAEMSQVCRTISNRHKSAVLEDLQPYGFSTDLRLVAKVFVELQTLRHRADYDLSVTYTRLGVLQTLGTARESFMAWTKVRNTDEANVFLAALLFGARWAK